MTTKAIDGTTYTMIDTGTYADPDGGEWVAFEKRDIESKIRWADRELAKLAGQDLTEYDTAAAYTQALEIRAAAEEDLRILELLFG